MTGATHHNISVSCPRCETSFDATGGGDGTWSTINGRLVQVADFLASSDSETLALLRQRLVALEKDRDDRKAAEALEQLGVDAPSGGWLGSRENRMELYTIASLLVAVIAMILMLRSQNSGSVTTPGEIERLMRDLAPQGRAAPREHPGGEGPAKPSRP